MAVLRKTLFPVEYPAADREAHRRVQFWNLANFRDLGGYRNSEGQQVKWGLLYRSDSLKAANSLDLKALQRLPLVEIIDLRSKLEQQAAPDRLPAIPGMRFLSLPIMDANSRLTVEARERIVARRYDDVHPDELLNEAYAAFVRQFTPQYQVFFRELLAAEGRPILWHCTAGKDRTGFAAALLLRILQVPMSTIMQDYMLTQIYWQRSLWKTALYLTVIRGQRAVRLVRELSGAKEEYLKTAFATIDQDYGSFDAYVHSGLGLTDAEIQTLRQRYLER
jgi:protein-tyrosine phosphatase